MIFFYKCKDCNLEFSIVVLGNQNPIICPHCGSPRVIPNWKERRRHLNGIDAEG